MDADGARDLAAAIGCLLILGLAIVAAVVLLGGEWL